jgi:hypothetical protein
VYAGCSMKLSKFHHFLKEVYFTFYGANFVKQLLRINKVECATHDIFAVIIHHMMSNYGRWVINLELHDVAILN